MKCSDIAERMVDHLYDALGAEERSQFDVHVTGCAHCQNEVATMDRTLGAARTALRGSLSEEAPPRVRTAVLAAAAAAHVSRVASARRSAAPEPGGFFAWLRRPWVVPAFAVASVMAIFVLAREAILNPEPLTSPTAVPAAVEQQQVREDREEKPSQEQMRHKAQRQVAEGEPPRPPAATPAQEAAPAFARPPGEPTSSGAFAERNLDRPATAPSAAPALPRLRAAGRTAPGDQAAEPPAGVATEKDDALGPASRRPAAGKSAARRFAEPPPPRAGEGGPGAAEDSLAGLGDGREKRLDLLRGAEGSAGIAGAPTAQAKAGGVRAPTTGGVVAAAPPIAEARPRPAASAPARAAPAAPVAKTKSMAAQDPFRDQLDAGATTGSRVAAPRKPARVPEPAAVAMPRDEAAGNKVAAASAPAEAESAAAPEPARARRPKAGASGSAAGLDKKEAPAADSEGPSLGNLPLEQLIDRADRAFAERRFADAAAAYRELLRRVPDHKLAPRWKERLAAAGRAQAGE